jgi:predicted ATPase
MIPLWGLWAYELVRGEVDRAQAAALQLRALADRNPQPIAAAVAAATNGLTLFYRGEFAAARDECARGLGPSRLPPSAARSARGVHDPGVMCQAFHAIARSLLGEAGPAQEEAAALRAAIPGLPPFDAAYAWCADAVLHTLADDPQATLASAERAIAIGREQAFPAWQAMGAMMHGWARARQGDTASTLQQMRRSFDGWCASGARNLRPFFLALLADASLAAGDAAQALQYAGRGLAEAATGERWWDPELHRLRAEALVRLGEPDAALDAARQALAIADGMGARAWAARANGTLQRMRKVQEAT